MSFIAGDCQMCKQQNKLNLYWSLIHLLHKTQLRSFANWVGIYRTGLQVLLCLLSQCILQELIFFEDALHMKRRLFILYRENTLLILKFFPKQIKGNGLKRLLVSSITDRNKVWIHYMPFYVCLLLLQTFMQMGREHLYLKVLRLKVCLKHNSIKILK